MKNTTSWLHRAKEWEGVRPQRMRGVCVNYATSDMWRCKGPSELFTPPVELQLVTEIRLYNVIDIALFRSCGYLIWLCFAAFRSYQDSGSHCTSSSAILALTNAIVNVSWLVALIIWPSLRLIRLFHLAQSPTNGVWLCLGPKRFIVSERITSS